MKLGIGLVDDFPMKAMPELRRIRIEAKQPHVVRPQDGTANSGVALNHSVLIVTVTTGVPVSDVLGNSLQHDGLVSLMQLPEGGLCRLWLMVSSSWLRLFLCKRKSRGCLHILCFIYSLNLFRVGEEQV